MAKQQKQVQIIARYTIKSNGYVCYLVRSSNGKETYCTTFNNQGKATGCTCPAVKPCYHMTQLEQREEARGWAIPEGKSLVRDDFHASEQDTAQTTEAWDRENDEDTKIDQWTRDELLLAASLGNNRHQLPAPIPTPTPRNVSMAWLCSRR